MYQIALNGVEWTSNCTPHLHDFLHIQIAEAVEEDVFEIEIYVDRAITALDNIYFVDVQRINTDHIYVSPAILQCSHVRIYDFG